MSDGLDKNIVGAMGESYIIPLEETDIVLENTRDPGRTLKQIVAGREAGSAAK